MARVLVVAMDPDYVDFNDAGMPTGLNKQKVEAEVSPELQELRDRGWEPDHCKIKPDDTAGPAVERQLGSGNYDCVLIGAGVRLPVHHLELFESVVNVVHRVAPHSKLAFNTNLSDSAAAVARQIPS